LPDQNSQEPSRLLRILVSVFSGALFGYVLSKLTAPTQNADAPVNANDPTDNETACRENIAGSSRGIAVPPVTPTNRPPSRTEPNDNGQERPKRHGQLVQWLIFLATAFYAVIAYDQWQTQINAMKVDQRAWVTVSDVIPTRQKDGSSIIRVTFKNTGKTPATDFTIRAVRDPIARRGTPSAPEGNLPGIGIIAPEGTYHSNMTVARDYDWKINDLFIHGTVGYKSVFKGTHWTRFCYHAIMTSDGKEIEGFAPCDFWNEVDPNDP
jgi:hypothetical protein